MCELNKWVSDVKAKGNKLTKANYDELAKASENNPVTYYGDVDDGLFHTIIMKYMAGMSRMSGMKDMTGMKKMEHKMDKHPAQSSHIQGEE